MPHSCESNLIMTNFAFFVLLALLGFSSGNPLLKITDEKLNNRIVGGHRAQKGQFPYQVSLQSFGEHFCGGSILNQKWILTAAHCVRYKGNYISVVVGVTNLCNLEPESASHSVTKVIIHSNSDLALVQIKDSITYSAKVKSINLPIYNLNTDDLPVVVSGWGSLKMNGYTSQNLQYLNTKVYDHDSCKKRMAGVVGIPPVTDENICTFTKEGEGLCYGDSGGPIVAGDVQVGIVSFGKPCAQGYPDVNVDVWKFVDWIKSNIN